MRKAPEARESLLSGANQELTDVYGTRTDINHLDHPVDFPQFRRYVAANLGQGEGYGTGNPVLHSGQLPHEGEMDRTETAREGDRVFEGSKEISLIAESNGRVVATLLNSRRSAICGIPIRRSRSA
jgi:hypothetical protein